MARYNEILVGRYNRALQKAFGIKGGPPVPQLGSEILANVNMGWGVENRYLEGWQRFGCTVAVNALASNFGMANFRNVAANNLIVVIEKISVACINTTSPQTPQLFGPSPMTSTADLGTSLSSFCERFDARGQQNTSMVITQGTDTAVIGGAHPFAGAFASLQGIVSQNVTLDMILFEDHEIPLLPGDGIRLADSSVNQQFNATLFWRERFIEDSERF